MPPMVSDATRVKKMCSTREFDARYCAEIRVVPSPALNIYFRESHCSTSVGVSLVSDDGGARTRRLIGAMFVFFDW